MSTGLVSVAYVVASICFILEDLPSSFLAHHNISYDRVVFSFLAGLLSQCPRLTSLIGA